MKPLVLSALCLVVATDGSVAPLQQVDAPPVLSITTNLVTLPVTVVDRRGNYVPGLRREHFTVYDNGVAQPIEFFASDDVPVTIGLVLDASGSMRARRAELTVAAVAFARTSHPLDEFFTVHFTDRVSLSLPAGVLFTSDPTLLAAAMSAAPARGMTALYDAVDRALDHLQRGSRERKALILVSDGADNASTRSLDAVLGHAQRTGAVVYAVALEDPDNRDARRGVLKTLARETGGRIFSTKRSGDLAPVFEQIAREIRSGYTIAFVPPDSATGFRTVRIVVDAGDARHLSARTRVGYYAGSPNGTR
jgi:VWFA-related protein